MVAGALGVSKQPVSSNHEIWTVKKILDWASTSLSKRGFATSRLDCELLLAEVLGLSRLDLYVSFDRPLSVEERESFKAFFVRRRDGEPVAYILGKREFFKHSFLVTPSVLIPRPETEILVEHALTFLNELESGKVLEIGAGSGCIALSIAAEASSCNVEAWDISEKALEVASLNQERLEITNLNLKCLDALEESSWKGRGEKFDLIVSNPPYIGSHETDDMAEETLQFEPKEALFCGRDGYSFYQVFASLGKHALKENGMILMEIGFSQAEKVKSLFENSGWREVTVHQDYAGLDRIVAAKK